MATTKPGVYKRGNKYWIRFSVGGGQVRERARTTREAEAVALLRKRQTEVFEGRYFPDKRQAELTVNKFRDMWLEASKHKKSLNHDVQRFNTIVQHFGAGTLIATIPAES